MKIRLGKKSDLKDFLKTQKEAFPTTNPRYDKLLFNSKVKNKEIFVIGNKKHYIGHVCFGKYPFTPPFIGSIFIEEFAVKKDSRNKGHGNQLMKYLIKYCKKSKVDVIYLGTGDFLGNKVFNFYKRLNFKKVGKLKDINPNSDYKYNEIFLGLVLAKPRRRK